MTWLKISTAAWVNQAFGVNLAQHLYGFLADPGGRHALARDLDHSLAEARLRVGLSS